MRPLFQQNNEMKSKIFLLTLLISLFFREAFAQALTKSADSKAEYHEIMSSWLKPLEQAEAVERELLKLIFKENELPAKSFFGKSKSAWLKLLGKKHGVSRFACQSYDLKKSDSQRWTLIETCLPKVRPEIIFVEFNGLDRMSLTFYIQPLSDLVGFGASILKSSFTCQLDKKNSELKKINCIDYVYSKKAEEVLKLESFVYEKEAAKNLVAHGQFFYEMLPEKSIDVLVPKEGKVIVTVKVIQRYREPSPPVVVHSKEPGQYDSSQDKKDHNRVKPPTTFGAQEPDAHVLPGAAPSSTERGVGLQPESSLPEMQYNSRRRRRLETSPPPPEIPIDQIPTEPPASEGAPEPAGGVRN